VRFGAGRVDALAELGGLLATGEAAVEAFLSNDRAAGALLRALHEPSSQLPACHVVTNVAGSSSPAHARAVADAAPCLIVLLESGSPPVLDLCCNALGNLAADGPDAAATIRAQGAVLPLVRLLSYHGPRVVLSAAFALSHVLRGASAKEVEAIAPDVVRGALAAFEAHGQRRDVAAELLWMLTYVGVDNAVAAESVVALGFAGVVMEGIVAEAAVSPSEHDPAVLCPALRVLGNAVALGPADTAVAIMANSDAVAALVRLVRSPIASVRAECAWVVATLANSDDAAPAAALVEAGVLPHIVALLGASERVAIEAVSALLGISHRTPVLAAHVVAANAVPGVVAVARSPDVGLQFTALQLIEVSSHPAHLCKLAVHAHNHKRHACTMRTTCFVHLRVFTLRTFAANHWLSRNNNFASVPPPPPHHHYPFLSHPRSHVNHTRPVHHAPTKVLCRLDPHHAVTAVEACGGVACLEAQQFHTDCGIQQAAAHLMSRYFDGDDGDDDVDESTEKTEFLF
jgi:hypothetical protein